MRGFGRRRALAVAMLATLASSSAAGWAVAFHLAADDHHGGASPHNDGIAVLELALHGHAHDGSTPAHGHPLLTSNPAPLPGKPLVLIPAALGDAPELAAGSPGLWPLLPSGPTHDPPPRAASRPVLRI